MCSERLSETYVVKSNSCDFVLAHTVEEGVEANKDCRQGEKLRKF